MILGSGWVIFELCLWSYYGKEYCSGLFLLNCYELDCLMMMDLYYSCLCCLIVIIMMSNCYMCCFDYCFDDIYYYYYYDYYLLLVVDDGILNCLMTYSYCYSYSYDEIDSYLMRLMGLSYLMMIDIYEYHCLYYLMEMLFKMIFLVYIYYNSYYY